MIAHPLIVADGWPYFFLAFFFGAAFFFAAIAFIPPLKPFGVLCRRWTPSAHEQEKSGG